MNRLQTVVLLGAFSTALVGWPAEGDAAYLGQVSRAICATGGLVENNFDELNFCSLTRTGTVESAVHFPDLPIDGTATTGKGVVVKTVSYADENNTSGIPCMAVFGMNHNGILVSGYTECKTIYTTSLPFHTLNFTTPMLSIPPKGSISVDFSVSCAVTACDTPFVLRRLSYDFVASGS